MRVPIAILAILMLSGLAGAAVQDQGQPIFDIRGHYVAYAYPDGSRDRYHYDNSWRMDSFIARDGKVTQFKYNPDGSMEVRKSDGTAVTFPSGEGPKL